MDRNNNDLLMLGIGILILGLILASYSVSTYLEIKNLSEKIDFEMIDNNNDIPDQEKYYKYLSISDFLNQKINQNKNIPIKNASCIYLDYAQHNAIELYRLTKRKLDMDESKKSVSAGNIRGLYNALDDYRTCKQSGAYKAELKDILDGIEKSENLYTEVSY